MAFCSTDGNRIIKERTSQLLMRLEEAKQNYNYSFGSHIDTNYRLKVTKKQHTEASNSSDANRHVNIYQSIMNMNFMEGLGSTDE